MLRTIALVGAAAAGIVGVGTAALAATGGSASAAGTAAARTAATGTTVSAASEAQFARNHPQLAKALARRGVHGEIVTSNGQGGFTTHDGIRGTVSDVSSTSITVKAVDGFSQTYSVTSSTKVRTRVDGKGAASAIGAVHIGDKVAVLGTGTSDPAATYVIDGLKR